MVRATSGEGRSVLWPADLSGARAPAVARLEGAPVLARLLPDERVELLTERLRGRWSPDRPIAAADGVPIASVWRSDRGDTLLPFDPDEAITACWSESYRHAGDRSGLRRTAKAAALRSYYGVRPLLPRSAQISLRRLFSRVQSRTRFPAWPIETGLADLQALLVDLVARSAGEPVPFIAPWPQGKHWALVLTHDVETEVGCRNVALLRGVEEALGYRSSWNFVPKRYDVPDELVAELGEAGFEVGVHGLYHDGRDLESRRTLTERLPEIRAWAERWGAVGFRSPATHRSWELMPLLPFDYDSSSPDTDPYEPTPGGCLSWLPFFNEELVELPITLPQDHTLFVILGHGDEAAWVEKTAAIREAGGMALLITHPDYMLEDRWLNVYRRYLLRFAEDPTVWRALPREISAWWRRRAASSIERGGDGWRVVGPAADEAVVQLAGASDHS